MQVGIFNDVIGPAMRGPSMSFRAAAAALLMLACPLAGHAVEVYPPVPGLAPSGQYTVRVRPADADGAWRDAFAWETACKTVEKNSDAYFDTLAGWTHTYVNFETAGPVEVEIARPNGPPIRTAAVHPRRKASACSVKDGKALVRLDEPCLVAVDIDGQMDGQDTGKGYKGPPIHTLSLFANPPLMGKPKPGDPGVLSVKPGESPPSDGPWTTLYFLPGVHDVGLAFPVRANRQYYIPGDAMVYGTFSSPKWGGSRGARIFGLGTLSGARLKHPLYVKPEVAQADHGRYRPIDLPGTTDTRIEGLTVADSALHSIMMPHPYAAGHLNEVKWTKILTWRANGDGINPFGNTLVEDCFIRTQDDSLYVNGPGIRRTVLWNDANGSSFVLSALPQLTGRQLVVADCDVIYSRAKWNRWSGGRVFNMRGEGAGACGGGVIFRNINIEDPRPTLQQFFICTTVPPPYAKDGGKRGPGEISGLLFQNISIAAPSVLNEPQLLWGQPDACIRKLAFEQLTVAGKPVPDASFFKTNEFVRDLRFSPTCAPVTQTAGTSVRETRQLNGWTLHIDRALLGDEAATTEHALTLLARQLDEIVRVVPSNAVAELRKVPLYFSPPYSNSEPRAEFHPGAAWLRENGRDPAMALGVEFTDTRDFEREMDRMPNFTLHELAHAFHHRAVPGGFDNAELAAAYARARSDGKYDHVERWLGGGRTAKDVRAYAMTNPMEYFAESSEAYFSRNDFFPFTRAELKQFDPEMFALLEKLWGVR